jgi:hypothetical protein
MGSVNGSPGLKSESELLTGAANAIVGVPHSGRWNVYGQGGCQVDRVKRTHRFRGKRTPCSLNNVQTESVQVPVRSRCIQVCPAIGARSFIDFSERDGAEARMSTRSHSMSTRSEAITRSARRSTSRTRLTATTADHHLISDGEQRNRLSD